MILNTDKPVLFIGDIHGNVNVLESAMIKVRMMGAIGIFVGDFVDSYPHSRGQQEECVNIVKENQDADDFIFLKGNHELAYINYDLYPCSGYSRNFAGKIAPRLRSIDFEDYVIVNDHVLVTHAGLSNLYIEAYNGYWQESMLTDSEMLNFVDGYLAESLKDPKDNIYKAGTYSGGPIPVGGIFWCRPQKFQPFGDTITQVFGHTKQNAVTYWPEKRAFGIDCLEFEDANHQVLALLPDSEPKFRILQV